MRLRVEESTLFVIESQSYSPGRGGNKPSHWFSRRPREHQRKEEEEEAEEAKYNPPSVSTWPEKIEEGSPAELECNASGGYPAGTIHWFDSTNTNWMKNATLEITEREDQLLHLSSKLTFAKIDSSWAPFRCVVLNSKFVKDGETTSYLRFTGNTLEHNREVEMKMLNSPPSIGTLETS
ncbi:hypothetical protein SRHO_G00335380 [Serrasalmus rhombeus]